MPMLRRKTKAEVHSASARHVVLIAVNRPYVAVHRVCTTVRTEFHTRSEIGRRCSPFVRRRVSDQMPAFTHVASQVREVCASAVASVKRNPELFVYRADSRQRD